MRQMFFEKKQISIGAKSDQHALIVLDSILYFDDGVICYDGFDRWVVNCDVCDFVKSFVRVFF